MVHLDGLVYLFGQSSVFGVRKRRPCVDDRVRPLSHNNCFYIPTRATIIHNNNKVNVVVECELFVYSVACDSSGLNPCPDQFMAFLNRDPPIMPNMYPPRERVPFYEGLLDSLIGWNLDEDNMLSVGQVYRVNQEMNEVIGVIDGGRTVKQVSGCL